MAKMRIFKFWNRSGQEEEKALQVLREQLSQYKKILKIN